MAAQPSCARYIPVDVEHAKRLDPVLPEDALLPWIHISQPDVHKLLDADSILWPHPTKEVLVILGRQPCQEADRHSVDVAAAAGLRRVDVGMRIDPNDSDLATQTLANGLGGAPDGSDGNAVVAAERQHQTPFLCVRVHLVGDAPCYGGHGAWVLHVAVGWVLGRYEICVEMHRVIAVELVPKLFPELGQQPRLDQRRGRSVDSGFALDSER